MNAGDAARHRTRRSSVEVRRDILAAAEQVFAERGYGSSTTRDIARVAGVTEAMIYRAFSSKRGLYEAAVTGPLLSFSQTFAGNWLNRADATAEDVLTQFVTDLYDLVVAHRLMFAALSGSELLTVGAEAVFGPIEAVSDSIKDSYRLAWDTKVATRAAVSMVVGMAVLGPGAYADEEPPSRDRVVLEMSRMLIGAAGLPRPGSR